MAETYSVDTALTSQTAAAHTVIEITPTSTGRFRLIELAISSDYTTIATPVSLKVELTTFATTGTGTAYTPKKVNGESQNSAALSTAKINDSVEPASQTVLATWALIVPGGPLVMQWPLGREGGYFFGASDFLGIRVTPSATVNVAAHLKFEE